MSRDTDPLSGLLDVAELLATGHRTGDADHGAAILALHINVATGLNWALWAAHRVGSDDPSTVPDDREWRAQDGISQGMMGQFVEGAFFSYCAIL